MPINPNIALQVRQPEPFDPIEEYGRVASLADLVQGRRIQRQRQQAETQQTQIENQRMQAASQEQAEITKALQAGGATEWTGSIEALRKLGTPGAVKMAGDLETALTAKEKAKRETEAANFKLQQEKVGTFANALGVIDNTPDDLKPAVYSGIVSDFQKRGFFPEGFEVPPEFDPQWVAAKRAEVMDAKAQIEAAAAKRKVEREAKVEPLQDRLLTAQVTNAERTAATPPNTRTADLKNYEAAKSDGGFKGTFNDWQVAEANRKQPRAPDERTADQKNYESATREGFKGGFMDWMRERNPRSATGMERKALGFYNRGREALETLTAPAADGKSLEDKVSQAGLPSQLQLKQPFGLLQTSEQQVYRQAQRAFTEARLRKESGAAVPDHEYVNDAKTYFAQPGDSKEVIEKKRKGRETVLKGIAFESGKAFDEFYGEPAPRGGGGSSKPGGGSTAKDPLGIR